MIPYSTDAPIYYFPWGTLGLIAANLLCFMFQGPLPVDHAWVLHFGGVLNPLEWLTNIFSHGGWFHLVGNLYFLWLFGLIVEGKLGWRRFVPLYLCIGIMESALSQVAMLGADGGGALGASGAIMGLMAICLVWAPRNEFSVILWVGIRMFFFDMTILAYSLFYLCYELIGLAVGGFVMSTPLLHLTGAVIGFAVGVLYLKKGWVDCENWDLLAVMKGTHGRFGDALTTVGSHADASLVFGKNVDLRDPVLPEQTRSTPRIGEALEAVDQLIDSGKFMSASERLLDLRLRDSSAIPDERRLRRLAIGLQHANAVDEAQLCLEDYAEHYPEDADWCRLRLARIELDRQRPRGALRHLNEVRLSRLSSDLQMQAKRTAHSAKQQIRSGVEDADDEFSGRDDI